MAVFLHHLDDVSLLGEHKLIDHFVDHRGFGIAAVQIVVDDRIVDAVQTEIHQAGQDGLTAFGEQELLQTVVAEGRELDIDLTDDADELLFPRPVETNLAENVENELEQMLDLAVAYDALAGKAFCNGVHADLDGLVGRTGDDLIGAALVRDHHDKVADEQGVGDLHEHGLGQLEAGVALKAGKVQRNNRNEAVAVLFERLAKQVDIVGCPAAAAGLRQDERDLMHIVPAGLDGVHQLTDDEQCGVTGVVMYVAQALLGNVRSFGMQQLHLVAVVAHQTADETELDREHIGHENGVIAPHLLGKLRIIIGFRRCVLQVFCPPLRQPACSGCGSLPRRGC